ncbi:EAL domain-containing protein [Pokkaliibacter sp. CJK22405]|uniref:EAL domain-containing protein n=1 Tax=Pokkaliibacter sp. CJK22405 TaxID=3384615 RepID=UPI0039852108
MAFRLNTLNSRLARRVLLLFVAAIILPVSGIGWLSYMQVRYVVHDERLSALESLSKSAGLDLFDRLTDARDSLIQDAKLHEAAIQGLQNLQRSNIREMFSSTALFNQNGQVTLLYGKPLNTEKIRARLASHKTQLWLERNLDNEPLQLFIATPVTIQQQAMMVVGKLEKDYLLPMIELPNHTRICVLDSKRTPILCPISGLVKATQEAKSQLKMQTERTFEWQHNNFPQLASYWDLFLEHEFNSPPWTIIANQPSKDALSTLANFTLYFVTVLVLVLLVVSLLCIKFIRRYLDPVKALTQGTERIASGEFDVRLDIRTRDEFGDLANSFNHMSSQLLDQATLNQLRSKLSTLVLNAEPVHHLVSALLKGLNQLGHYPYLYLICCLDNRFYWFHEGQVHHEPMDNMEEVLPFLSHRAELATEQFSLLENHAAHFPEFPLSISLLGSHDRPLGIMLFSTAKLGQSMASEVMSHAALSLSALAREQQLMRQAHYDALTGLLNRRSLEESVQSHIEYNQPLALLFIDIDRFKQVNDVHGHGIGDALLKAITERLTSQLPSSATLARYGGDEFLLVLPGRSALEWETIARNLMNALKPEFVLQGRHLFISASIGCAQYPTHGERYETLLRHADLAMYAAKMDGRNTYCGYNDQLSHEIERRSMLEYLLRTAEENGFFHLFYQPKVDANSGKLIGFEALMRCRHPTEGMISPVELIPVAEETGLIIPLGMLIMRQALEQFSAWQALDGGSANDSVRLAINVSALQILEPDFIEECTQLLEQYQIAPELIEFELTESLFLEEPELAQEKLSELRRLGITIAIDDFGTGYSSLSYFSQLPVDALKIDRSFVIALGQNHQQDELVRTIVHLAHTFNLKVIAEGVEELSELKTLQGYGCDIIQGYYFSKPLESDAATALIASRKIFTTS